MVTTQFMVTEQNFISSTIVDNIVCSGRKNALNIAQLTSETVKLELL